MTIPSYTQFLDQYGQKQGPPTQQYRYVVADARGIMIEGTHFKQGTVLGTGTIDREYEHLRLCQWQPAEKIEATQRVTEGKSKKGVVKDVTLKNVDGEHFLGKGNIQARLRAGTVTAEAID